MVDSTGTFPLGSMLRANNGKFYGVTYTGGCQDSCVIFNYDPLSGVFHNIHDFECDSIEGYYAMSGMYLASDGNLYGLCSQGGVNGCGTIYKVDPNTNIYTDIFDFSSTTGKSAYGTLIQYSNGKLYGMTYNGGAYNSGVLFSFDPTNSTYTLLRSLQSPSGIGPGNTALLNATNGLLYGMTNIGGAHSGGVIFSYNVATNIYTDIYDFNSLTGANPSGSLIQATNGLLYGITGRSGANNEGVIFNYDINTNTYTDIYDFDSINGYVPVRSLMQASNGKLYGLATGGGAHNCGVAFSYNITNNTFTKIFDFDSTTSGRWLDCELIETPWVTGIQKITNTPTLTLFPNPANITITLHSQTPIPNSQLIIEDVLGNKIYQQLITNNSSFTTQIDVSTWSEGVYFYEVRGANDSVRGKFIKE